MFISLLGVWWGWHWRYSFATVHRRSNNRQAEPEQNICCWRIQHRNSKLLFVLITPLCAGTPWSAVWKEHEQGLAQANVQLYLVQFGGIQLYLKDNTLYIFPHPIIFLLWVSNVLLQFRVYFLLTSMFLLCVKSVDLILFVDGCIQIRIYVMMDDRSTLQILANSWFFGERACIINLKSACYKLKCYDFVSLC